MTTITVPSSAIALRSEQPLTPALVSVVWETAAALDEQRSPATVPNYLWLKMLALRLREEGGRADNVWLRQCLDRLTGVKLSGEYRGDPWGAVVLAERRITEGGGVAQLLVPPLGVHVLRSPDNFTKIEATAAHRLTGHGQRIHAILADKKRLGRPSWTFDLAELRVLMGVDDRWAYDVWWQFQKRVLKPALEAMSDYGTVSVKISPQKRGRSVAAVRFDWRWKDPHDATETAIENERHSAARRKAQDNTDAPPMIAGHDQPETALTWWHGLTDAVRNDWVGRVGRTIRQEGPGGRIVTTPRREADIARAAYEEISTNA